MIGIVVNGGSSVVGVCTTQNPSVFVFDRLWAMTIFACHLFST
jgi:hypothetical protein